MSSKIDTLLVRGIMIGRLEAVRNGETSSYDNDLLRRMLTAATEGWEEDTSDFNLASVLNDSKLFYFAGQDSTASTMVFAMLMLALNPAWQDRARKEVQQVLGDVDVNFNARVLTRFELVPSPKYKHHQALVLTTRPKYGLPLIFKAL